MKGVRGFIVETMPQSWDFILRKNRCYKSFIDQFYNAIAKEKNKNKYYFKVTIQNARHYMKRYNVVFIATLFHFKEGLDFWNNIQNQISDYELNCN